MLTLAVTDGTDGTASATIAGTSGASVSVYARPITALGLSAAWDATAYIRIGDGSLPIALAAGGYWFYAVCGSLTTAPVYSKVSDGLDPVRTRILSAVFDVCTSLALPRCASVAIRTKRPVGDAGDGYPKLEIWRKEPDDDASLGHWRDNTGYAVPLLFKSKDFQPAEIATLQTLGDRWHQTLARTFKEPDAIRAVVPEVWNQVVSGKELPEGDEAERARIFGGLVVTFHALEPRGLNA